MGVWKCGEDLRRYNVKVVDSPFVSPFTGSLERMLAGLERWKGIAVVDPRATKGALATSAYLLLESAGASKVGVVTNYRSEDDSPMHQDTYLLQLDLVRLLVHPDATLNREVAEVRLVQKLILTCADNLAKLNATNGAMLMFGMLYLDLAPVFYRLWIDIATASCLQQGRRPQHGTYVERFDPGLTTQDWATHEGWTKIGMYATGFIDLIHGSFLLVDGVPEVGEQDEELTPKVEVGLPEDLEFPGALKIKACVRRSENNSRNNFDT